MKYSKEKIQLVKELPAPARKNFPQLKLIVQGLDEYWQADLIDMKAHSVVNRSFKYILSVRFLSPCFVQDLINFKPNSALFTFLVI